MNVLCITAYNKPDLLYIYLEQIYRQKTALNYKIRIYTEDGYDKENDYVVGNFKNKYPKSDIQINVRRKHPKCPLVGFYNILASYADSRSESESFVIFGEEDIIPSSDYLRYNEYIYYNFLSKRPRLFCAAHKRRPETEKFGNPEVLISDYQLTSPSVVSNEVIDKYIIPHLNDELFENPIGYYKKHFSGTRISEFEHTHHDGFLERVMISNNMFALKPDCARTMHVGLSGIFCKGSAPSGSFIQRLCEWRGLLLNPEELRARSSHPEDMTVIPLHAPSWSRLFIDVDRTEAKESSWWYDTNNDYKMYEEGFSRRDS